MPTRILPKITTIADVQCPNLWPEHLNVADTKISMRDQLKKQSYVMFFFKQIAHADSAAAKKALVTQWQ